MPDINYDHLCPSGTRRFFLWDDTKDRFNLEKHGIAFKEAVEAFCDPMRIRIYDHRHSTPLEKRFLLIGKTESGTILTVRYTRRDRYIRIIGAGRWRQGVARYSQPDGA